MVKVRTDDELPSIDRLHELFLISEDGDLIRNVTVCRGKSKAFSKAGYLSDYGYWKVSVDGKMLLNHRIVWAMTYGYWPAGFLDHKNGIRSDNRPSNLRLASNQQNSQNRSMTSNKTGYRGVTYDARHERYRAEIMIHKKHKHLGMFSSAEEASSAYEAAAKQIHGSFYRPTKGDA